jgi:putative two-component system response regulator
VKKGLVLLNKIKDDLKIDNDFFSIITDIIKYHHEKWDGSGYPYGLKGEDIPLSSRLMAIVDVYDALTSKRPYKRAFTHKEAINLIFKGKGTHFDPEIVDVFEDSLEEFEWISLSSSDFKIEYENIDKKLKKEIE